MGQEAGILIAVILADETKIVLVTILGAVVALVTWSIINAKNKADKTYVDNQISDVKKSVTDMKQYVRDEIDEHKKTDAELRNQVNNSLNMMNSKLDLILKAIIPNQNKK